MYVCLSTNSSETIGRIDIFVDGYIQRKRSGKKGEERQEEREAGERDRLRRKNEKEGEWRTRGVRVRTEIGRLIWRQKMIEGEEKDKGIYIVPFALRFGHYDLAGIRLTGLVILFKPLFFPHVR